MVQQLGAENGFDVEIWDPNLSRARAGRRRPAFADDSPFLDLTS